jgi:Helix-turn-helix domain
MAEFAAEVRRLMTERGMSLRGLAKAASYDASYLSKVLSGHKPSSPYLAARLDDALSADGTVRDTAQQPPPRQEKAAGTPRRKPSGAVEALQVAMTGDPAGPDIGADGLAELVRHYAHALAVAPSPTVYGELLSARSFAGTPLGRAAPRQRPDLTVTAGWLSSLLAISAADLGDHAAAVIWCADTERRGQDASYPELLGWAALTRSLTAWYQGDPLASAAAARRGQAGGQPGSVAHAKLAAQEMRCRATLGDAAGMAEARRKAATAMAQLGPPTPVASVYSVPRAEDPPYTATSLLLAGRYAEAAQMTQRIIDVAYRPQVVNNHASRGPGHGRSSRRAGSWRAAKAPARPVAPVAGITRPRPSLRCRAGHERGGVYEPPMLTDQPVIGEPAEISVVDQERPAGGRDAHELALVGAADLGKRH